MMNTLTSLAAKRRISIIAGVLLVIAAALGRTFFGNEGSTVASMLLVVVAAMAGTPIALSALRALRVKAFSIELLVTIAVIGALIIREFEEAAVVSFLFILGAYLETRTISKTRESLKALIDMAPKTAEVVRDGTALLLPVDDVRVGDVVIARIGTQIPVDGTVINGSGAVAEAAITGEPLPKTKAEGDAVWSGTTLDSGYLEVRADRLASDSTFAHIVEIVEEAQDSKAHAQKFLDKFARIYTPSVIIGSLIAFAFTRDVRFALTFLVIACPGALVISTPVSLVAGIGNASVHGVLIKGGDALERAAKTTSFVMDKTGTVTAGEPRVTNVVSYRGDLSENRLLAIAAQLELASEHPLGRTIVAEAVGRGIDLGASPARVNVIKGAGIEGVISTGEHMRIGALRMYGAVAQELRARAHGFERGGKTASFVAIDGEVVGIIAIADRIRDGVAEGIDELRESGIHQIVMLTGDNEFTAQAVARAAHIDEVRAELLPQDKVAQITALQEAGARVAMVGDGINDAPALASADLGIAMGGGTDIAMQSADIILMGNRFDQLVHARKVARATVANMKQNTAIALFTVAVLIGGVLFGVVNMGIGMFVHEVSVLVVILNAVRLRGFGRRPHKHFELRV
ncbi:MAG: cation-translocating P-type ATPase [Actinomycetaceae bacterium]|nr:cation-translocating P-type ATPase [Arcanobacterium sp.]MDD7504488.1 cation-translocating P-type ATPase [Actinomycetaceae bacterium]